ncbi:MAG: hypothetical protein IT497_09245 [Ottowia sp.]|nr:hypothetical protein [Ottowia sp.]
MSVFLMADLADLAEDLIDRERIASVQRVRENVLREVILRMHVVVCRNCEEVTSLGQAFCDSYCRDDFEKFQHLSRIKGRAV